MFFKVKALFAEVVDHTLHLKLMLKFKHVLKAFAEQGCAQICLGGWGKPGLRGGNLTAAVILARPQRSPGATESSNK